MKRKDFLKTSGFTVAGLGISGHLAASASGPIPGEYPFDLPSAPLVCILVPSETLGPFPSLPSGDAMYWRNNISDGMVGLPYNFTIKVLGANNCGVMQGYRVDVWHCNPHGYYSHYATGGANNGHSGQNSPGAGNASLIYGRGTGVTDVNGEVSFSTVFPGWYPGRTWHIHFAVYHGGTIGSSNGWILDRVSQFTIPIAAKNTVLASNAPYNLYGADPQSPDMDNVFNTPAGEWAVTQLATFSGTGAGPYSSFYEFAISATGTLPLTLVGFDGSAYGQSCLLRWRTENEANFSHFELEYSPDADDFEFLATLASKGNNLPGSNDYIYEDRDRLVFGNAFYRLKMVDMDGAFAYSAVVSIHNNLRLRIAIRTNPVSGGFLLFYHPLSTGKEKIMITDSIGRSIGVGSLAANVQYTQVDLGLCSKGAHFLIYSDGKYTHTIKFLIQ